MLKAFRIAMSCNGAYSIGHELISVREKYLSEEERQKLNFTAEQLNTLDASPFEIRCINGTVERTNNKFEHTYYINVETIDSFGDQKTLFSHKDLLLVKKADPMKDVALQIYYPYTHLPAIVQVFDYYDTYWDIVEWKAVEDKGWVTLDLSHSISARPEGDPWKESVSFMHDDSDRHFYGPKDVKLRRDTRYFTLDEFIDKLKRCYGDEPNLRFSHARLFTLEGEINEDAEKKTLSAKDQEENSKI